MFYNEVLVATEGSYDSRQEKSTNQKRFINHSPGILLRVSESAGKGGRGRLWIIQDAASVLTQWRRTMGQLLAEVQTKKYQLTASGRPRNFQEMLFRHKNEIFSCCSMVLNAFTVCCLPPIELLGVALLINGCYSGLLCNCSPLRSTEANPNAAATWEMACGTQC